MFEQKKTSAIAVLVFAILVAAGAACQTSPSVPATANVPVAPTGPPSAAASPVPTKPPASPSPQGSLVFAHPGDLRSIDPQASYTSRAMRMLRHVYEPLIDFDSTAQNIIPVLAESWKVSDDGLTWTFRLRQGVKFGGGQTFDAKAVLATIERGQKDKALGFNFLYATIAEATSPDPYTVVIKTVKPQAAFLQNFTVALMMPPDAATFVGKVYETPNGTGPFKVVEYKTNDHVLMEARSDYWRPGIPRVKNLTIRVMLEDSARMAAAQAGEVDIAEQLPAQFLPTINGDSKLTSLLFPVWGAEFVGFNCTKPPFDNPKVRQAVSYAVNRDLLAKDVMQIGVPISSYPPKGVLGWTSKFPPNAYDMAKAKALMAEANYPNGFKTSLLVAAGNFPKIEEEAQYFASELKKIGIDVELKMMDSTGAGTTRSAGNYDMYIVVSFVVTGDPDRYFDERLARDTYAKQGCWANQPELNKLIVDAGTTIDRAKRQALYEQIQDAMWTNPPFVWLDQSQWLFAVNKRVKNFQPSPTGIFTLQEVSVE